MNQASKANWPTAWLKHLWYLSMAEFVTWFAAALTVDLNGRVFGLQERASLSLLVSLFLFGTVVNAFLAIFCARVRFVAITFAVVHIALASLPAMLR